jgi:hypothetical protein
MIKLYKNTSTGLLYWETWEHEGTHTVHWGKVGEIGEDRLVRDSSQGNAKKAVQQEILARRKEGYAEIEDLHTLVIQYRLDNWGNESDLERRYRVEDLMNECLGWTGLGHCDGGDIGSGTINIFCLVVDPHVAIAPIVADLEKHGELAGATIAVEKDDDFEVLFPDNFAGEFKLL